MGPYIVYRNALSEREKIASPLTIGSGRSWTFIANRPVIAVIIAMEVEKDMSSRSICGLQAVREGQEQVGSRWQ